MLLKRLNLRSVRKWKKEIEKKINKTAKGRYFGDILVFYIAPPSDNIFINHKRIIRYA